MKNIPYDKDCPLQRVEEGDAVEISVMHLPNKFVRDKDVKKYGHIPNGVYHAVAVAPYKLKFSGGSTWQKIQIWKRLNHFVIF